MKRGNGTGRFRRLLVCAAFCILATGQSGIARAQSGGLNNQPYNFGGKGLGMSYAGKQAILSNQVLGIRPDNLIIGPGGVLLYAEPGPSGSAIVYDWYNVPIPGYHGRGWRSGMYPAVPYRSLFFVESLNGADSTAAALGWTGMIGGEEADVAGYLLPVGLNTLDLLVWQVYMLSPQ